VGLHGPRQQGRRTLTGKAAPDWRWRTSPATGNESRDAWGLARRGTGPGGAPCPHSGRPLPARGPMAALERPSSASTTSRAQVRTLVQPHQAGREPAPNSAWPPPHDGQAHRIQQDARHRQDQRGPHLRHDPRKSWAIAATDTSSRSPAPTSSPRSSAVRPSRPRGSNEPGRRSVRRRGVHPHRDSRGSGAEFGPRGGRHPDEADGGPPRRRGRRWRRATPTRCAASSDPTPVCVPILTHVAIRELLGARAGGDHGGECACATSNALADETRARARGATRTN